MTLIKKKNNKKTEKKTGKAFVSVLEFVQGFSNKEPDIMLPIFHFLFRASLGGTTSQLLLKCENKYNLVWGVFTPETKELRIRESCQLGGEREGERARERQRDGK